EALGQHPEVAGAVEGEGRLVGPLRVDQRPARPVTAHPPQHVADQGAAEAPAPGVGADGEALHVAGARPPAADDVAVEAVAPAVDPEADARRGPEGVLQAALMQAPERVE